MEILAGRLSERFAILAGVAAVLGMGGTLGANAGHGIAVVLVVVGMAFVYAG